ncbi:MAG: hypothetical protein JNL82_07820 [Myxococcales bacterium]|nr:hypothetical protein [Myxococcales bacterium]
MNPRHTAPRDTTRCLAAFLLLACNFDSIEAEGAFGSPIALATGDKVRVPRLAWLPEACPGTAGGCSEVCLGPPETCPADACLPVLVDSGTAITTLSGVDLADTNPARTCFELRSAAAVMSGDPAAAADARAVFRFSSVPLALAPRDPAGAEQDWSWRLGNAGAPGHVGGIIGGNLLREFAVLFSHRRDPARFDITFYREFPGSEEVLADQGRAAIPLQFPGLLLGKDITDVCQAGGESCDFMNPFDRQRVASALQPTRMVVDACLAAPPAMAEWVPSKRACRLSPGPGSREGFYRSATGASGKAAADSTSCTVIPVSPDESGPNRGYEASLVVATGVPGLILFEDSARRLFQDLDLPACSAGGGVIGSNDLTAPACIDGYAGKLDLPGWPPAGSDSSPVLQIRVRSVGLVPGLAETAGASACQRLEWRQKALKAQCDSAARGRGPRLAGGSVCASAARSTAAVLGEAFVRESRGGKPGPNPSRWITTLVIPADHPMVTALRRDVNPEALQPDGLLGSVLFHDSDVVLDYTDGTPGLRVSCSDPDDGTCTALPACDSDRGGSETPTACCYGLPEDLLISLIDDGAYACCAALSPSTIDELNLDAVAHGREPPCPRAYSD